MCAEGLVTLADVCAKFAQSGFDSSGGARGGKVVVRFTQGVWRDESAGPAPQLGWPVSIHARSLDQQKEAATKKQDERQNHAELKAEVKPEILPDVNRLGNVLDRIDHQKVKKINAVAHPPDAGDG